MIAQRYFKEPVNEVKGYQPLPAESDEKDPGIDERILCRNCSEEITDIIYKININSSDFHLFKNPMGIYFRVVCFSSAAGCSIISDYTVEFTWFSGYSWAIALCRRCGSHLGWHYKSEDSAFYGLIADRLTGI